MLSRGETFSVRVAVTEPNEATSQGHAGGLEIYLPCYQAVFEG